MPDPSSLTTLQAEILALDARSERDNQRIAEIRAAQDARQKTRDELAAHVVRAMKASDVSANYIDGPGRTIWWLASGKLRYETLVSGAAIPVAEPVPVFPADDQVVEAAEFGPKADPEPPSADLVVPQWYGDRLIADPKTGEIRVSVNGMLADMILNRRLRGHTRNSIVREHPPLTIADVLACEQLHYCRGGTVEDFWHGDHDSVGGTSGDKGTKAATDNSTPAEAATS